MEKIKKITTYFLLFILFSFVIILWILLFIPQKETQLIEFEKACFSDKEILLKNISLYSMFERDIYSSQKKEYLKKIQDNCKNVIYDCSYYLDLSKKNKLFKVEEKETFNYLKVSCQDFILLKDN